MGARGLDGSGAIGPNPPGNRDGDCRGLLHLDDIDGAVVLEVSARRGSRGRRPQRECVAADVGGKSARDVVGEVLLGDGHLTVLNSENDRRVMASGLNGFCDVRFRLRAAGRGGRSGRGHRPGKDRVVPELKDVARTELAEVYQGAPTVVGIVGDASVVGSAVGSGVAEELIGKVVALAGADDGLPHERDSGGANSLVGVDRG